MMLAPELTESYQQVHSKYKMVLHVSSSQCMPSVVCLAIFSVIRHERIKDSTETTKITRVELKMADLTFRIQM